jgi:hypothetical protein
MKNNRAIFLLVVLFFTGKLAIAQFIIDPGTEKKYKDAVKKIPREFLVVFKKKDEPGLDERSKKRLERLSYGIFTLYTIDTLNKADLIPRIQFPESKEKYFYYQNLKTNKVDSIRRRKNDPDFYFSDPETGKPIRPEKPKKYKYSDGINTYMPIPMFSELKKDSLRFAFPMPFEPTLEHIVTLNSVTAFYHDRSEDDSLLRIDFSQPLSEFIRLPMKQLHFALSNTNFVEGNIIYGEAEMMTPVFYKKDPAFKSGYLKKQLHYKYVFQVKVIPPELFP